MLNQRQYEKRFRRIKVRGKLEQNKYNLFREENEGYSKLITELLQGGKITTKNLKVVKENMFSLIGYFDIDPNRALDVVLTAFEFYPDNVNYIELIKEFKVSALASLIGSKFEIFKARNSLSKSIPTSFLTNPKDVKDLLKND